MRLPLFISTIIVCCVAISSMVTPAQAEPGGCLKYGAGGAVAGHFVGQGHAVLGAAGGCAVGMYKRHEARKEERNRDRVDPRNNFNR